MGGRPADDRYVWLNQYTNPGNWRAHYRTTAPAIARYGVMMADGSELAPDSFLIKGEELAPRARWGGNPARET